MITPEQISNIVNENKEEAIRCLTEIVQVPSVTGNEELVSKVFTKWMESIGLTVGNYPSAPGRPNLLAEWFGSEKGPRFIFNGHMDVFPPTEGDPGPYGPWSAKIVDGHMYGRGTSDMKGGDCAALMAVKFLHQLGFDPKGSILLSYLSDEENGGWLGAKYLVEKGMLNGDFGICMEPTQGKLLHVHWGILRLRCTYKAMAHHAGSPHPSTDALQKAVTAINRFYELDKQLQQTVMDHNESPCLSITTIEAGSSPNVQPAQAVFTIDRRICPGEKFEDAYEQIIRVFEDLKAVDPEYDYQIELLSDRPTLEIPEDDPFIKTCQKSYEQIMGKPLELYRRSGGSDAATIRQAHGISIPNWGAATDIDEWGAGSPKERINLSDYLDSIKYYMMTVVNALS